MYPVLKRVAAACAGAMLLACANTPEGARVPEAGESAAERNRQATELAEKADYAAAIAIWRSLTAVHSGPESAYLYRNLGYALFLNGEYDASLAALEKACLLDPLNARGWLHLGSALRKMGQEERAEMMLRQAATLEKHEFTGDYALARGSTVPAIVSAVAAPPRTTQDWASGELDGSSGVVDLRAVVGTPEAAPAQPVEMLAQPEAAVLAGSGAITTPIDTPVTESSTAPRVVRLEVRNGNGVTGMAAATARQLASESLQVVRLTNQKGFGVERTRIEYESGYKDAASKLAEKFGAATMVQVDSCWKADMRLVIGKDLVKTRPASMAAASAPRRRAAAAKGRESASAERTARASAPPARG
ncbi:MAG TPA: LytR C-terminal domain-containing protein [Telluria sp.]